MKTESEFVEACEALAESFEQNGRTDLAALCDLSAYWLNGGDGIDLNPISEVVSSCRDTISGFLKTDESLEMFIARTEEDVLNNLRDIEAAITYAATCRDTKELVDRAAKLQAVAILTSNIFNHRREP